MPTASNTLPPPLSSPTIVSSLSPKQIPSNINPNINNSTARLTSKLPWSAIRSYEPPHHPLRRLCTLAPHSKKLTNCFCTGITARPGSCGTGHTTCASEVLEVLNVLDPSLGRRVPRMDFTVSHARSYLIKTFIPCHRRALRVPSIACRCSAQCLPIVDPRRSCDCLITASGSARARS